MERLPEILTTLKGNGASMDVKLKHLTNLKQDIKHRHCPDAAIPTLFDVVRISIATAYLTDAGFSILGHLMKRLILQDQQTVLQVQGVKTYPYLLDRLADQKDRNRQRALQALSDFHAISDKDVESFVRDTVLTSKSPKVKEAGMQLISNAHEEKGIHFRMFIPIIVNCLEDADGSVRRTAQTTIISLFQNAAIKSTNDLQKQLEQRHVRKTIVAYILSELGLTASFEVESAPVPPSGGAEPQKEVKSSGTSTVSEPLVEASAMSVSEKEADKLDPLYIDTPRDFEDTVREMQPYFEGKESEGNWLHREKSILKLRKITKGNAPKDFTTAYLSGIKTLLDGILKTVNSLRTTVSTIACHLVQDIARVAGSGIDNMVEILLQNLIKLCANTKKITASKGNVTVAAIMANVSYSIRLTQHIYYACQDKNVQPRTYACGWLKTIIEKHGHHKSAIEHGGGVDLIEKCIKAGLADRDGKVRESMRPTYWAFAHRWPAKSEGVMAALNEKQQELLIEDSANPNPEKRAPNSAAAGSKSAFSQSTGAVPARPSIKETIASQKKAKEAARKIERPSSAESIASPNKSTFHSTTVRPGTAMSSASRNVSSHTVGTLSSAPVRPRRRADVARPATADPYASRKTTRTETPPRSPAISKAKTPAKTPAVLTGASRSAPKKSGSPATSPGKANSPKRTNQIDADEVEAQLETSPTRAAEDFTMVIPNMKIAQPVDRSYFDNAPAFIPSHHPFSEKTPLESTFSELTSVGQDIDSGPVSPAKLANDFGQISLSGGGPQLGSPIKIQDAGRVSLQQEIHQRMSPSPRAIVGRKEALTPRKNSVQNLQSLKVYEDPEVDRDGFKNQPSPADHTPRALEELPVNEPLNQHRLLAEESRNPAYHQKWLSLEAEQRRRISVSENVDNPLLAQRILASGIVRIRARQLDAHGFRKLQGLIRTAGDSIWEEGYRFDELLTSLLDNLEAPNEDTNSRSSRQQDLRTQVLVTVRLLLKHQPGLFSASHPRAICAILAARRYHQSTSHIVCGLEETAESIVELCDPLPCIDSVLDYLVVERADNGDADTISMCLYVLAGLLHRCQESKQRIPLSEEQERRLGRVGSGCLADTDPDIRRAVVEFVLELHDAVPQEDTFWRLVAGARDDHRSLITYYLVRKRSLVH